MRFSGAAARKETSNERQIARDITYSSSASSRAGRTLIRAMENATGRISLIKRVRGYGEEVSEGRDFWQVLVERYGLQLDIVEGSLENIPATGPVIVVANHPYGILDGVMIGYIMSLARGDFRILAHRIFKRAEDLNRVILPVSFDETKEAVTLNIATRKEALRYLSEDGCIGIFPGGTVSTSAQPMGKPMDPGWRAFTAKMIAKSDATVVPIYFEGSNSRLFQLASHLHSTLRTGLLIREFKARVGTPVKVVIGKPIEAHKLDAYRRDPKNMMDFLRRETYALSPAPIEDVSYGFEFEEKHGAIPRKSLKQKYKDRHKKRSKSRG